eukprot:TRINITY_DN28835_c0_g1_i1.p1 TRINITY_DN28835_c0_g1~~TRINITY_DN28835_c0_g1_i1.p1  ORF type:complete len:151 (+),score=24.52 TRINITY_DN28835_c0_g1_i1:220-672(+)
MRDLIEKKLYQKLEKVSKDQKNIDLIFILNIEKISEIQMKKNRDLRIHFMEELIKAEPNYDSLAKLNDQINMTIQEISLNFYKEMIEMRKTLTPEQALEFFDNHIQMMKKRIRHSDGMNEMRPPEGNDEMRPGWSERKLRNNRQRKKQGS